MNSQWPVVVSLPGPEAELYLYPGDRHLFTDRGTDDHDPAAAALVLDRVVDLLGRLD